MIVGAQMGRLTLLAYIPGIGGRETRRTVASWECLCSCGATTTVRAGNLRDGKTQSCGCIKRDEMRGRFTTHGHATEGSRSSTYNRWGQMIQRCTNPDAPRYADYGGRGIQVCDRWRSFANFLADMGEAPLGLTLDREDNDGDYTPTNCRWATYQDQARNRNRRSVA